MSRARKCSRPRGWAAVQRRAHANQRHHQLRLQREPRDRNAGALGTISGGGNSFSFNQSDYNSLWVSSPETDTASYSIAMSGTETYAPGGSISGGSDSFTWNQNAYDKTTINYDQLAGTAAETNYEMLVTDTVSDTMYDVGSDVLGASDSIVSNGDAYTIIDWRQVTSTIVDSGSSVTPFYIYAVGIDDYTTTDTGSSTLSASGQSYGLDTVTYGEIQRRRALPITQTYIGGTSAVGNRHRLLLSTPTRAPFTNSNG